MSSARLRTFDEFWPYYLGEHRHPTNRRLHALGTTLALASVIVALVSRTPLVLVLTPVCGYGLAWVGHFFVERNRPATFTYPRWSLLGDFKMYGLFVTGRLDGELARFGLSEAR